MSCEKQFAPPASDLDQSAERQSHAWVITRPTLLKAMNFTLHQIGIDPQKALNRGVRSFRYPLKDSMDFLVAGIFVPSLLAIETWDHRVASTIYRLPSVKRRPLCRRQRPC
jgi:hypothetical protein